MLTIAFTFIVGSYDFEFNADNINYQTCCTWYEVELYLGKYDSYHAMLYSAENAVALARCLSVHPSRHADILRYSVERAYSIFTPSGRPIATPFWFFCTPNCTV